MTKQQTTLGRHPIIWVQDFLHLARPYWTSKDKYRALILLILVIILNLSVVAMTVVLNKWYNGYYDAIQNYDKHAFMRAIIKFCYLAFFYISFNILATYFKLILEIRWRRWSTNYYIQKWF